MKPDYDVAGDIQDQDHTDLQPGDSVTIHRNTAPSPDPASLVLIQETKLWRLLPGCDAGSRLEASGVFAHEGHVHVIFDNMPAIATLDANLAVTPDNRLVGRTEGVLGFEDITYNDRIQRYYTLVEALPHPDGGFRPQIEEYTDGFDYLETCWVDLTFEQENKGLEGIVYLPRNGRDFVLGLCEGNMCQGGKAGRLPGGGRIHVLEKQGDVWKSAAVIALPASLAFEDYASLAVRGERLAVASQCSSELWVGELHPDTWEVVGEGDVYRFPRSKKKGRVKYCTVEGISWLDDTTFVAVSDRIKAGEHPPKCEKRDQSIHIFRLPEAAAQA